MSLQKRLLTATFFESFATILLERGVYFYSESRLDFDKSLNLWLALLFGGFYIAGALASHPVAKRISERQLLLLSIVAQAAIHLMLALVVDTSLLFVAMAVAALCNGLKWPVVESYVTAGRHSRNQLESIGHFNVAWASAVPLSLLIVGPLLGSSAPSLLFYLALGCNVIGFGLCWFTPRRPLHLPDDHPERPSPERIGRYRVLLASSQWSMLACYALLFLLAPMLPAILARLDVALILAPAASALIDLTRLGTFVLLQKWHGWYGRAWPMWFNAVGLPISCLMTLFGGHVVVVLIGEIIFGFCCGLTYYCSLYYVIASRNASVDAGGAHEGLIGAGFLFGPAAGLVGVGLSNLVGSYVVGMLIGIAPLILLSTAGGLLPLRKLKHQA